jgi:hypothetical protein
VIFMRTSRFFVLALFAGLLALPWNGDCRDRKKKPLPKEPQDAIEVVGHVPAPGGPVTRFLSTQHYSSYYLYVEHDGGRNITLVDVSRAAHPVVLAEIPNSPTGVPGNLFAVAGTAALTTDHTAGAGAMNPQTIRIMDFSDPKQPKVVREFGAVTAMSGDDQRGLVFVANPEGVWILQRRLAVDPEVEREYERRVWYDH